MRYMPHALAAFAALVAVAFLLSFHEAAHAYPYVTWTQVGDRPLLETVGQVTDARLHKPCSFRIGNELFVAEDIPKGYVDYSAKCVRMP